MKVAGVLATLVVSAAVDLDSAGFDYGTNNLVCEDWYGTLVGGGHTQSDCLSFCEKDYKCTHATYYAQTGYCHISSGCNRQNTSSHASPITYHKKGFAVAEEVGKDSGCPTCPPTTTTTTTCAPATTTAPPTTTAPATTKAPPTLPTSALFEAYNSRMKDTCTGKASLACHDGTVEKQGSKKGYMLTQPISGFTEELFAAYSSRIQDTCTGKSTTECHDGTVQQMGSSQGFILKNPIPSKTAPLYVAYSSRMHDTCTGPSGSACHDGSVNSMGSLVGHMLTTQSVTLQDVQDAAIII